MKCEMMRSRCLSMNTNDANGIMQCEDMKSMESPRKEVKIVDNTAGCHERIRVVMSSRVVKEVTQGENSSAHQVHEIESFKQMLYRRKFGIGDSRGSCRREMMKCQLLGRIWVRLQKQER